MLSTLATVRARAFMLTSPPTLFKVPFVGSVTLAIAGVEIVILPVMVVMAGKENDVSEAMPKISVMLAPVELPI
jgi:hypothetical protein